MKAFIQQFSRILSKIASRWIPDPLVISMCLTVLVLTWAILGSDLVRNCALSTVTDSDIKRKHCHFASTLAYRDYISVRNTDHSICRRHRQGIANGACIHNPYRALLFDAHVPRSKH